MGINLESLGAVHTRTHTIGYDLKTKLDRKIKLNLIYKKIEKLE